MTTSAAAFHPGRAHRIEGPSSCKKRDDGHHSFRKEGHTSFRKEGASSFLREHQVGFSIAQQDGVISSLAVPSDQVLDNVMDMATSATVLQGVGRAVGAQLTRQNTNPKLFSRKHCPALPPRSRNNPTNGAERPPPSNSSPRTLGSFCSRARFPVRAFV